MLNEEDLFIEHIPELEACQLLNREHATAPAIMSPEEARNKFHYGHYNTYRVRASQAYQAFITESFATEEWLLSLENQE